MDAEVETLERLREQLIAIEKEEEKRLNLRQRAEQLIDNVTSPADKEIQALEELDEVFRAGLITNQVYQLSIQRIKDQFAETEEQINQTQRSLGGFQAAAFGSAEAISRIQQQRDLLSTNSVLNPNALRPQGQPKAPPVLNKQLDALKNIEGLMRRDAEQKQRLDFQAANLT